MTMPTRLHSGLIISAILSLTCTVAAQQQVQQKTPIRTEVTASSWDVGLGIFGLTQDLYNSNHLSRLTRAEIDRIIGTVWEDGFKNGETSLVPTCGPTQKDVDRSTVKLFLDIPSDAD